MISASDAPIMAYTHKQLAAMYNVSWPTLQRWLDPYNEIIGPKQGHFYNAKQVTWIFEKFGTPKYQSNLGNFRKKRNSLVTVHDR